MKSAKTAVEDCLCVKSGERVTIVTDTEISPLIYHTFAGAVMVAGGIPTIVIMEPLPHASAEPPDVVAAAMCECDAFINCCSRTITHTKARNKAQYDLKRRYLVMPAITEDALINGTATADFKKVKERKKRNLVLLWRTICVGAGMSQYF